MHGISRRNLLRGLGAGAALSLPFLRSAPSSAATGTFPKRFVVFFSANEPIGKSYWEFKGLSSGGQLPQTFPNMLSALQPFRSKLNVIGNMKLVTRDVDPHKGGHTGIGHTLTGRINDAFPNATKEGDYWAGGISVDQYLAQKLGVEALTLGAMPGGANGPSRISYTGPSEPVHPIDDPKKAFDKMFGTYVAGPDEAEKIRAQKKSVLDMVAKDIERLKLTLPSEDKQKVEIHLEHIRAIEKKVATPVQITCDPKSPTIPSGYDYKSNKWFPTTARLQMDILAQSLACGLTQVGTIQLGNSGSSNLTPSWPDEGLSVSKSYHTLAHDWNQESAGEADRIAVEKFWFKMYAYLLQKLDEIPEGDGSVLDNSIVLYAKPIGTKHSPYPMLYLLAGGGGGVLPGGRYHSFDQVPHNNLLTSIVNMMGFDDAKFGDPNICTGAVNLT